jgi:hypothetical protein
MRRSFEFEDDDAPASEPDPCKCGADIALEILPMVQALADRVKALEDIRGVLDRRRETFRQRHV